MPYSTIFINKKDYKLLKKFKRSSMVIKHFTNQLHYLESVGFIEWDMTMEDKTRIMHRTDTCSITQKGLDYIEWHQKKTFHYWVPVVLSIAAIIISIIAIIVSANTRVIVLQ